MITTRLHRKAFDQTKHKPKFSNKQDQKITPKKTTNKQTKNLIEICFKPLIVTELC
jgi:hypothetical protein